MACSTDPTNAPESADCAVCAHKTRAHYMRQNGSFGCRHCGGNSEHRPPEHHIHTYNIAGVCTTCGRDADAMATDHHFCENDDSPTRGATMVLDMLARIVTSDRDDADVGLMVRRVLNEPTLKAIRKAAYAPAAPQPRETRCDPDVPHYYGLPATGCFNCFPPGSPDPYASTDDGKGAGPESAGGEVTNCQHFPPCDTAQECDAINNLPMDAASLADRLDLLADIAGEEVEERDMRAAAAMLRRLSTPAAPQPETTSTIRLNDHPLGLQMDAPQPEPETWECGHFPECETREECAAVPTDDEEEPEAEEPYCKGCEIPEPNGYGKHTCGLIGGNPPQPETEGMTFDEWLRMRDNGGDVIKQCHGNAETCGYACRGWGGHNDECLRAAWTAAKGGR